MLKIFLIIQLLICLSEQSLPQNNSKSVTHKVCDSSVTLDKNQYIIKGRFDEIIYCNLKSINKCSFKEHTVYIDLMVNNVSYCFNSVDCKRQTFDLRQEICFMKILLGIEDLHSNEKAEEYNISCVASFETSNGRIVGESSFSSLKVFRGELLHSMCSETKTCISDRNITCTRNHCRCKSEFVSYTDDYGVDSCAPTVKHNQQCHHWRQCNQYNSLCTQTSIGKICQCSDGYYWNGNECKYGYTSQRSCPYCYCGQTSCSNEWSFKLNVLIFISGMIGGIFVYKTCMCCITKSKRKKESEYVLEEGKSNLSSLTLEAKDLGKKLNDKLIQKLESFKSDEKSEPLETVKVKY